nr:cupin domain-containing protein [Clostridia bacterium]
MPFFEKKAAALEVILIRRLFVAPIHLHEQLEVAYCQEGEMDIMIDNRNHRLHAGDVAVIFPFLVHSYSILNVASSGGILFIAHPSSFPAFAGMLTGSALARPVFESSELSGVSHYALSTLCGLCENDICRDADLKVNAWLNLLLSEMHGQFDLAPKVIASRDLILKALVYIQSN